MSEWTPAGVLTIFENRRGAGVNFFKERSEPEWNRSQFFNKRLFVYYWLLLLQIVFNKACNNITFKCAILFHRKSFYYNLDVSKVRLVSFMCVKIWTISCSW